VTQSTLHPYQREFIELALKYQALRFGEFKLKSGRISPYFFNCGLFNSGAALAQLTSCYMQAIVNTQIEFDQLFGPAYKGIPLVSGVAIAFSRELGRDYPYSFNRKETKDHGEGGMIVGAPLEKSVFIIDDVITAGTAINEAIEIIYAQNASIAGIMVALDRQERGYQGKAATEEVKEKCGVAVKSIVTVRDLLSYLEERQEFASEFVKVQQYWEEYGI
jgi:orotate phosphoribosyltransferase